MAVINGTSNNDTLMGTGDADTIRGRGKNDLLLGGNDHDMLFGDGGNDVLNGEAGNDTLEGGAGADTLDGGSGADVLRGGDGNDVLIFDAADLAGSGTPIDGGDGSGDVLRILSSSVDFTGIDNTRIGGIEILDLSQAASGANSVTLNVADVLALSSSTNRLIIEGGSGQGDHVSLPGGFTANGSQRVNGETYNRYVGGGSTVLVDQNIAVNLGASPNNSPVINDQSLPNLNENSANGTVVGAVTASDPDAGQTLTYAITGGNPSSAFAINSATGQITVNNSTALNFEASPNFALTVQVTDNGTGLLTDTGVVTIKLNDVAEFVPAAELDLSSLNGANGFRIEGEQARQESGFAVASAGDVNGDGLDDLLVAPGYVVFGGNSPLDVDLSGLNGANGFQVNTPFNNVSLNGGAAGDINGDGFADAIFANAVVFGKSSGFPANLDISILNGSDGFSGGSLGEFRGSANDFNGDGYDDLVTGSAQVIFGAASGFASVLNVSSLNGSNGFKIESSNSGIDDIESVGDVNGDGYDDLILRLDPSGGAVLFGQPGASPQVVHISALDGTDGFRFSNSLYFSSISSAGDVNGDGFDDAIIGSSSVSPHGNFSGVSYVVFGKADAYVPDLNLSYLDGVNGFRLAGEVSFDNSGLGVSSAGDFNGAGFDDLLIAAPGADSSGESSGAAYVVFGHGGSYTANLELSALDGSNGFQINGEFAGDNLGGLYSFYSNAVASAGDVNGDGFDDLIVAAPRAAANELPFAGVSYVVYGEDHTGLLETGTASADARMLTVGEFGIDGREGNDNLVGNSTGNTLIGGLGNDTLDGGGGSDVLIGAAGDDVLIYDAADTLRVDGGTGMDTLRFAANQDLNLNPVTGQARDAGSLYTGIERFDLVNGSGTNDLTLDLKDVLNLSDSINDLFIDGDAGDSITATGGFMLDNSENMVAGYNRYEKVGTDAQLYVDTDITSVTV